MSAGPSASLQLTGSFYWGVDSIGELEQSQVVVAGISIGPFTIDFTFRDGKPIGVSAGFGIGAGDFGMHVYSPKSLETHYFRDKRQPETNQNSASTGNNSTNNDPNRRLFYVDEVTDLLNDPNHKFIHVNEFSVYKVY